MALYKYPSIPFFPFRHCMSCRVVDPPYFTLRPKPIYQRQPTQSVVLPCAADGDPRPVISWRKVSTPHTYRLLFVC